MTKVTNESVKYKTDSKIERLRNTVTEDDLIEITRECTENFQDSLELIFRFDRVVGPASLTIWLTSDGTWHEADGNTTDFSLGQVSDMEQNEAIGFLVTFLSPEQLKDFQKILEHLNLRNRSDDSKLTVY